MDDEQKELLRLLKTAVDSVYAEERFLMNCGSGTRKGLEQAFVFRTGVYLNELLKNSEFSSWDLDSEYNKNGNNPKITARNKNGIRPDLLLHKRLSNQQNKLAVEFKGWWNGGAKEDMEKLEDLTDPRHDYKYKLGVFVKIGKTSISYKLFINGREFSEQ